MATKHSTSAAGLSGGARIGATDWDLAHVIDSLDLTGLTSDPGTLANGMVWYRSDLNVLKARINGVTVDLGAPDWSKIGGKPTTLAGFGITDAQLKTDTDLPYLIPATGDYIPTSPGLSTAAGTGAGVANRFDLYPFVPRADIVATDFAINCTTAVAATNCKIVIYASDANGRPDALVYESGDLSCATTGVKSSGFSGTLTKGKQYWVGARFDGAPSFSTWSTGTPEINGGTLSTTARKILRRTLTYATAAPSNWGFTNSEITTGSPNALWFKV